MSYLIMDVSSNNAPADWTQVKKAGIAGVWVKATEGLTYNSPSFVAQTTGARKAGLRVGAYHYARPDLHPYDPEGEAQHFCAIAGSPRRRDLKHVLDFEVFYGNNLTDAQATNWIKRFNGEVRRRTGLWPMFYSYSAFIHGMDIDIPLGNGLWLANYGPNDGKQHPAPVPPPWKKIHAHQFTSRAHVPGQPGEVDLSAAPKLRAVLAHGVLGLV